MSKHTVKRYLNLFSRDQYGNAAILFCLAAIPFFGILGAAIDYGVSLSNKAKLDAAADAASLAAVKAAQKAIMAGSSRAAAMAAGSAMALSTFKANAGSLTFASVPIPTLTWSGSSGQTLSSSITYTTSTNNLFGKLLGQSSSTTAIASTVAAQTILTPYYQFIFVVDISGSMSIGGTASDVAGMNADKNIKCAFACHDPNHNRGPDYRAYAKADGWTLKIDYVNSAIQNFISDLKTQTVGITGVFSVGINTFATSTNVLQPPTSKLDDALASAAKIDIEPMSLLSVSQGYTRTTRGLNDTLAALNNIGDGSSSSSQKTYIIFLSDGVEDIEGHMVFGRGSDLAYTSACDAAKKAGATMISIVAPYPVVSDSQYPILVAPLAPRLVPTMQSCASGPSWAFQATDGPAINNAVKTALQQILQGILHLTQ